MLMKFLEWVGECEKGCIRKPSQWEFTRREIQGDELVITGKKVRNVKAEEVGRFLLPERVVELPVPAWVYVPDWVSSLGDDSSSNIPQDPPSLYSTAKTIPMFLSEAAVAAAVLQTDMAAILDA
jgi:hypothetical protein